MPILFRKLPFSCLPLGHWVIHRGRRFGFRWSPFSGEAYGAPQVRSPGNISVNLYRGTPRVAGWSGGARHGLFWGVGLKFATPLFANGREYTRTSCLHRVDPVLFYFFFAVFSRTFGISWKFSVGKYRNFGKILEKKNWKSLLRTARTRPPQNL